MGFLNPSLFQKLWGLWVVQVVLIPPDSFHLRENVVSTFCTLYISPIGIMITKKKQASIYYLGVSHFTF